MTRGIGKLAILFVAVMVLCGFAFRSPTAAVAPAPTFALTLQDGCPSVPITPRFTFAYGTVQIAGAAAPVGTVVEARNPRGDTVGCFVVHTAGYFGAMYVYGEDATAQPVIPGMREGEVVAFFIDGTQATASPPLEWHDDRAMHEIILSVTTVLPTSTPTLVPTRTPTGTPTSTPTPTPTRTPMASQAIMLTAGWNLVGLPLAPLSESLDDVLEGVPWTAAYAWDCANQEWLTAFREVPGPRTFTNVDVMKGFWVDVDSAATLVVRGDPAGATRIPLCPGWNLISFPSQAPRPLPDALQSIAGSYDLVYEYEATDVLCAWKRYNPLAPPYASTLHSLTPGRGYWIHATEAVTLTVE